MTASDLRCRAGTANSDEGDKGEVRGNAFLRYRGGSFNGSRRDMDAGVERIELGHAIDGLYEAFGAYPLKERIDCCPHCELGTAERRLHIRPLRELTWTDLGIFSFKALTSFGDTEDLRHFLPRLLELYVLDHAGAPHTLFMLCHKLDDAKWTKWPADEVGAIRTFIDAWKRVLAKEAPASDRAAWELDELSGGISAL
jgi:hypothetical protein